MVQQQIGRTKRDTNNAEFCESGANIDRKRFSFFGRRMVSKMHADVRPDLQPSPPIWQYWDLPTHVTHADLLIGVPSAQNS